MLVRDDIALRTMQAPRKHPPAQVGGQHRALSDGKHASLGPGVCQAGHVPCCKDVCVPLALQGALHTQEARLVCAAYVW